MRVFVVENPIAGVRGGDLGEAFATRLRRCGFDVVVERTSHRGDAAHLARATTADVVAVVGGDGTFNEVVNGVFGQDKAVVAVPAGLSNVTARCLGLHTPKDALNALIARRFRNIDVFVMETGQWRRFFVAMGGFGFDGSVVEATHTARKKGVSFAGYVPGIIKALFRRHKQMDVFADGEAVGRGRFVVVANVPYYGGPLWLLHRARFDDGLLDVLVSDTEGLGALALHAGAVFGRHLRHRRVRTFRCRHLFLRPAECGHIDGEPLPAAPDITIRFAGKLKVAFGEKLWRRKDL